MNSKKEVNCNIIKKEWIFCCNAHLKNWSYPLVKNRYNCETKQKECLELFNFYIMNCYNNNIRHDPPI
jgi:hypothetical protein